MTKLGSSYSTRHPSACMSSPSVSVQVFAIKCLAANLAEKSKAPLNHHYKGACASCWLQHVTLPALSHSSSSYCYPREDTFDLLRAVNAWGTAWKRYSVEVAGSKHWQTSSLKSGKWTSRVNRYEWNYCRPPPHKSQSRTADFKRMHCWFSTCKWMQKFDFTLILLKQSSSTAVVVVLQQQ